MGDFQIRAALIQHAGWEGGQHGWEGESLIRWIFASGWLRQSIRAACRAIRRRRNLGWASTRRFSGCGASERPAALRRAKMGGHKPKAISGKHRDWLLERAKVRDFTLRGLVAELAERGLKVDYRSVWEFVHAENLSFKKKRRRQRTRPS